MARGKPDRQFRLGGYGNLTDLIKGAMQEGDYTSADMAALLDANLNAVSRTLHRMRDKGLVHIKAYVFTCDTPARRYPRALFVWGPGENAVYKKVSRRETLKRKAAAQAARRQRVGSVFDLASHRRRVDRGCAKSRATEEAR